MFPFLQTSQGLTSPGSPLEKKLDTTIILVYDYVYGIRQSISFPKSPQEKQTEFTFLKLNNAKTDIDLLRSVDPDLNDEQALELYTKNKAFNESQQTATELKPTQQPNGKW